MIREHLGARLVITGDKTIIFLPPNVLLNLLIYTMLAPVAQWIEHRSSKPMVAGSIPAGCATVSTLRINGLHIKACAAPF